MAIPIEITTQSKIELLFTVKTGPPKPTPTIITQRTTIMKPIVSFLETPRIPDHKIVPMIAKYRINPMNPACQKNSR
jgi:hypothetical protein